MPDSNYRPSFAPAIEAFTEGFIQNQRQSEATKHAAGVAMLSEAKKNPELFDDPQARKVMEAAVGKDNLDLISAVHQNKDALHNTYEQAIAMGLVPDEEQGKVAQGEAARSATIKANENAPTASAFGNVMRATVGKIPGVGAIVPTAPPGPQPVPASPIATGGYKQRVVNATEGGVVPGASTTLTEKGGTSVQLHGPTVVQSDERKFYSGVGRREKELIDHGMPAAQARQQAVKDVAGAADAAGVLVPKDARALANADTKLEIDRRTKEMQKNIDLAFKAPEAAASAQGRIAGEAAGKAKLATDALGPEARNLGAKPTPTQLQAEALDGRKVFVDKAGNTLTAPKDTKGGIPAGYLLVKPETLNVYNRLVETHKELATPEVMNLFPSERDSPRAITRIGSKYVSQFTRPYTDQPAVDAVIKSLKSQRAMIARLETGGAGATRAKSVMDSIGALTEGIEQRSISREQAIESLRQLNHQIAELGPHARMHVEPGVPDSVFDALHGGAATPAATGAGAPPTGATPAPSYDDILKQYEPPAAPAQ